MIISIMNTIGALARRLGIVKTNLQMWLGFTKADVLGKDLVVNGDFATDLSGWINTIGGYWSWDATKRAYLPPESIVSVLTADGVSTVAGNTYLVEFDAELTSNKMQVTVRTSADGYVSRLSDDIITGHYSFVFVAQSNNDTIGFYQSTSSVTAEGYIDNVSIKEVTQFAPDKSTNTNNAKLFTGKALEFNGNDSVNIDSFSMVGTDATFAFWFYPTTTTGYIIDFDAGVDANRLVIGFNSNNLSLYSGSDGVGAWNDFGSLTSNAWNRVVVSISGTAANCYVNNSQLGTTQTIGVINLSAMDRASIGSGNEGLGSYLSGKLSDFQIYNTAWDSDDAAYDYANPNHLVIDNPNATITKSNLIGYWALSEGSGNIAFDSAGLGGELVVDGDFPTGSTAWLGGASSISNGQLTKTGGGLAYQLGIFEAGVNYKVTVDVESLASGVTKLYMGSTASAGFVLGVQDIYIVGGSANTLFGINDGYSGGVGSVINSISVREVTDNEGDLVWKDTGGSVIGATWVDQQPTIPQLGMMDWSKGSNLIPYSEDFSNSDWTKTNGATIDVNSALSPNNTMTADKITFGTSLHSRIQKAINGDSNTNYTFSTYVKSAEVGNVDFEFEVGNTSVSTQVFTATNEWQRFSLTVSNTGTVSMYPQIQTIDTLGDSLYIWGAQLEESSTVGSYIGTAGSAASNATLIQNPNDIGKDVLGNSLRLREGGFNLDGSGYAEVADDDSLDFGTGDFSMETWVKYRFLRKDSSYNSIVCLGGDFNDANSASLVSHTTSFRFYIGSSSVSSTDSLVEGDWYHVVGTRTGTTTRLYIDGIVETITSTSSQTVTNALSKIIGDDSDGDYDRRYEDLIDDVRLYNRALTQKEITNNYLIGLKVKRANVAFEARVLADGGTFEAGSCLITTIDNLA